MGRVVFGLGCVCRDSAWGWAKTSFLPSRYDVPRFSLLELFTDTYLDLGYF